MSKGLRNIKDKHERLETIRRRASSGTKGLGMYGALDALKRMEESTKLAQAQAAEKGE